MSNEAKVGLFVLATLTLLVATFLYIANVQLTGQTATYRTYFSYVGGLDGGSMVRYGGRKAGTVRDVRPWSEDMTRSEVVIELRAEIPVNAESVATIASLNALGTNYLEITPGSSAAPRIPPGGVVPSLEALTFSDLTRKVGEVADGAVELMARIDEKMTVVADDLHDVLVNLRALSGEDNQRNVAAMLENANELLETQTPRIDSVMTQLLTTLGEVERLARDFREVADGAATTLEGIDQAVEEARPPLVGSLNELETILRDAKAVLADARALVLVNEGNVSEIIDNFRRASEDIEALTADLRQRPWRLLRTKPLPDREVPATSGTASSRR